MLIKRDIKEDDAETSPSDSQNLLKDCTHHLEAILFPLCDSCNWFLCINSRFENLKNLTEQSERSYV